MSSPEVFYMLYVKDGGKPNQVYLDHGMAIERAKVLARETRKEVYVLTTTHRVTATVPDLDVTYTVEVV